MSGHGEAPLVAVIATGGTIASRRGADGASTPSLSGEDLLALVPQINARLKPVDLMAKDSSSLTLADMQRISDAVGVELNDPAVTGVVVLHGTDAMEESSLLVHLQYAITKPVVFTGAQFTADHPNADGPSNLAAAIETALDQTNAERGVLLSFGGRCLPAWGLYKLSADAADAFRSARPAAHAAALELAVPLADLRVDIVAIYPGCDAAHIEASLQAGADDRACRTWLRQRQSGHRCGGEALCRARRSRRRLQQGPGRTAGGELRRWRRWSRSGRGRCHPFVNAAPRTGAYTACGADCRQQPGGKDRFRVQRRLALLSSGCNARIGEHRNSYGIPILFHLRPSRTFMRFGCILLCGKGWCFFPARKNEKRRPT